MALRAQFLMTLKPSSTLVEGLFEILDDTNNVLKSIRASSGIPSAQTLDDVWRRGRGPIPPTVPGKREYSINIVGRYYLAAKGISGLSYPISPDPIYQIGGPGMRSEIMLHWDANGDVSPGSAGCIVLRVTEKEYDEFNDWILKAVKEHNQISIPLLVAYKTAA